MTQIDKEAPETTAESDSRLEEPIRPDGSTQTYASGDIIGDSEKYSHVYVDGLFRATEISLSQRINFLRDLLSLAIPIVVGAVTFLVVGKNQIKSIEVFYLSLGLMVAAVVTGLLSRRAILLQLQTMTFILEGKRGEVSKAARELKVDMYNQHKQMVFFEAVEKKIDLPQLGWIGSEGFQLVMGLFLAALLGLAASLVFHIGT